MKTFTHDELCCIAVRWLKRSKSQNGSGCRIAFTEARNGYKTGEIPDAIGFRYGVYDEGTVLVEAKTTRSDFLSDKNKPHRINSDLGIGVYRYFIAPEGLISVDELPEKWGLLEVNKRGSVTVKYGHIIDQKNINQYKFETRNFEHELGLLSNMLARIGDVDEFHRKLKAAYLTKNKLVKQVEKLEKELRDVSLQLYMCKQGEACLA